MMWKVRRVVHHVGTIEAIVAIDLHRSPHIHLALIHKNLCKARQLPTHVAKMHPSNLIGRCHLGDGVVNAFWTEELRHTALAKKHRVTVARGNVKKRAAKLSQRRADLRHAAASHIRSRAKIAHRLEVPTQTRNTSPSQALEHLAPVAHLLVGVSFV